MYLAGGLGNQIFQYHAGVFFSQLLRKNLCLDLRSASRTHSAFDITSFILGESITFQGRDRKFKDFLPISNHINDYINNRKSSHLVDKGFAGNIDSIRVKSVKQASGYFQSFLYLQKIPKFRLELRAPSVEYLRLKEGFSSLNLAVHIRRGDFVGQSKTHGLLSSEWYLQCIKNSLGTDRSIKCITYFTDDPEMVRESILKREKSGCDSRIIGPKDLLDPAESWMLIRDSRTLIVSNSTFSLTAAAHSNGNVIIPEPLTLNNGFKEIASSMPVSFIKQGAVWE
jgi:hypothetical protein